MRKIVLKRTVTATGGRQGVLKSADQNIDLKIDLPPELGGKPEAKTTNPEQLFATGYASCFASSLEYILKTKQVAYRDLQVEVTALLLKDDDQGGFKFGVEILVTIFDLSPAVADQYVQAAYQFCPYSKAIRGNVEVKITVADPLK